MNRQSIACCNVLQYVSYFCFFWGRKKSERICTLKHTALHRTTLQHTAIHCNTVQHTLRNSAVTVKHLLKVFWRYPCTFLYTATYCNTLQTHCNIPQHSTRHRTTLQQTATYCTTALRILCWEDCYRVAKTHRMS